MSPIAVLTTAMSSMSIAVASETTASVQFLLFVPMQRPYAWADAWSSAQRTISGPSRGGLAQLEWTCGRPRSPLHAGERAHVPGLGADRACLHRERLGGGTVRRCQPRGAARRRDSADRD